MFKIFIKNKGKKAPKPKAKTVKAKGGKKAGAKAKGGKKARAKDEVAAALLEQNSAMPKSQGISWKISPPRRNTGRNPSTPGNRWKRPRRRCNRMSPAT